MKKKIIELTNQQMNKICEKHSPLCKNCPLSRTNEKGNLVKCYKWARAFYYFNVTWFETSFNGTEEELKDSLEILKKEQIAMEQKEIDV